MQAPALQILIGTALTDRNFCRALLNGSRGRILQSYPLSPQEVEIIMAIRADTLEEFAGKIHENFLADADDPEPMPTLRRVSMHRKQTLSPPVREQN